MNLKQHTLYTESDYNYFKQKGYTDKEILAFWNRDLKRGHTKGVIHNTPPDVIGMLNKGHQND